MPVPLVSALMNVFNGEAFVEEACRSVLGQTLADLELVVVDDGSTDGTAAILRRLADADARVVVVTQANAGITAALNAGLRACRGEFVAKMDADDVSLADRFATQVGFLRAHPDIAVVGGAWQVIDARGRLITTLYPPVDDAAIQSTLLRGHAALTHSCAMVRRSVLEQVGGYDESFKSNAEDLDLWLRIGEVAKLHNLPDVVLKYRVHDKSISETRRAEQREHARRAVERAWARRRITDGTFEATDHWRQGDDRASRFAFAMKYGWWAWKSGERSTARSYALRALRLNPLSPQPWTLLAKSATTPPPAGLSASADSAPARANPMP